MDQLTRYDLTEDVSTGEVDITPVPERMGGRYVTFEDYEALQQQLTATTNSLTNAQEALKSAGIEADTVQAGVKELVNKLVELEKQEPVAYTNSDGIKALSKGFMVTVLPDTRQLKPVPLFTHPVPPINLNAVRAEGVDKAIEHLHNKFASTGHVGVPVMALEWLSAELRAGNAGKDGSHD